MLGNCGGRIGPLQTAVTPALGSAIVAEMPKIETPRFVAGPSAPKTPHTLPRAFYMLVARAAAHKNEGHAIGLGPAAKISWRSFQGCIHTDPAEIMKSVFGVTATLDPNGSLTVPITELLASKPTAALIANHRINIVGCAGTPKITIDEFVAFLNEPSTHMKLAEMMRDRLSATLAEGTFRLTSTEREAIQGFGKEARDALAIQRAKFTKAGEIPPCVQQIINGTEDLTHGKRRGLGRVMQQFAGLVRITLLIIGNG